MLRPALVALFGLLLGGAAYAQPVEVRELAAPDAFSTPGRDTGLGPDLWRGASIETARIVLPLLAAKPLSPAGAALARRVLATGAAGPPGASGDATLAGARTNALIALGDVAAASRILERTPGLDRAPDLARGAAETALLSGDTARACQVAEGLSEGREQAYWLRLRAFCQAEAGQTAQAQLTFDLAQAQARDAVFGRLMAAKLSGAPAGAPASRGGLDRALSRSLGLDVPPLTEPQFELPPFAENLRPFLPTVPPGGSFVGADPEAKPGRRLETAVLLAAAASVDWDAGTRASVAKMSVPAGKAPVGRDLALEDAARRKLAGETALLALWTCAEAGAAGPSIGDRIRIVRALAAAGLAEDARNFVAEGLAALK